MVAGSYGTLVVLTEISIKVLPKSPTNKTIVIENPHLRKALEYLNLALSSSNDPSGGVFYPEYFRNNFTFNDLTTEGPITAIRIEGPNNSVDHRIKELSKLLNVQKNEIVVLEHEQSNIFWEKTRSLQVFSNLENNLLKIVLPFTETFEVINKLKIYKIKYFVDWGGGLIWVQINDISSKILKDIKGIVEESSGYVTIIKIEENLKASVDIFTIDPIKYKITEKIKKSFDPKRILNPGKMYSGI
jgi:glycolate oxidase FAD binding subunit